MTDWPLGFGSIVWWHIMEEKVYLPHSLNMLQKEDGLGFFSPSKDIHL